MKLSSIFGIFKKKKIIEDEEDFSILGLKKPEMKMPKNEDDENKITPFPVYENPDTSKMMNDKPTDIMTMPKMEVMKTPEMKMPKNEDDNQEKIKSKIELISSHIENIKIQQDVMNNKITNIEDLLKKLISITINNIDSNNRE